MKAIKNYAWAIKIAGAVLLVGLALILVFNDGDKIVAGFLGTAIIIYSVIRLVPFVKTQKSDLIKTINIIEITVSIMIGLVMIVVEVVLDMDLKGLFSYLIGGYLMMRGAVHFYSVSNGAERTDFPLYVFHILALTIGSYIFTTWGKFDLEIVIFIILFFSVVTGGYLSYDGYKGYKSYRYQKQLMMPKVDEQTIEDEKPVEKRIPTIEEEPEQDQIVS